jgi:glycosyltransferase involved in cell wall biosynthesis
MFANKHTMMKVHTRSKYLLGDPVFLITQKCTGSSIDDHSLTNAYFVGLPSNAKGIHDFAWLAKEFEGRIKFHWITKCVSPELKSLFPYITFVVDLNDDQLVSYIQRMDIFLNCSHFEGFSLPTAEAIFLEKCAFSYKLPEIYSSFGDHVTSYIKPFDLTLYKTVLTDYLGGTIGREQYLLQRGKQMIIERYSPDVVLNKMLEVIHAHYEK